MIAFYKSSEDGLLQPLHKMEPGCWINMVNPSSQEISLVVDSLQIDPDFVMAALDEEERPRIEMEREGYGLIVVDFPMFKSSGSKIYETMPIGIVFYDDYIVTVCLRENPVLKLFIDNKVKTFYTYKKSRFILQILYKTAILYLQYLRQIDKQSSAIERELHKSMKNKELIQLLELEKSLVYFSTSLKSNDAVMEKLWRNSFFKKYEEDTDLLEDTIIENKQAIEMAKIYSDILAGTMDAFASIISNNLNIVMKLLTSLTIVMAVPTMIFSFFGMNVPLPYFEDHASASVVILGVSAIICAIITWVMSKKKMF